METIFDITNNESHIRDFWHFRGEKIDPQTKPAVQYVHTAKHELHSPIIIINNLKELKIEVVQKYFLMKVRD